MDEDDYPAWYTDDSHEGFQQWDEGGNEEDEAIWRDEDRVSDARDRFQ